MEIYSFNKDKMLSTYHTLLANYYTAGSEDRIKIYNEILGIKKFLGKYNHPKLIEMEEYKRKVSLERKRRTSTFMDLEMETRTLCKHWKSSLDFMPDIYSFFSIKRDSLTKQEFEEKLLSFFRDVLPEDLELVLSTFRNERIEIKKTHLFSPSAEIMYLESLEDFYIRINCNRNLNNQCLGYVIHEFGHASSYLTSMKWQSYDYILEEVIASLYEMLFIDYKDKDKSLDVRLSNMKHYFKSSGFTYLYNYFEITNFGDSLYEEYLDIVIAFYAHVIALTLFARKEDKDFKEQIRYIKENFSSLPAFKLLEDINIKKEDLIYTTENIKQRLLIRK